MSERTTSSERSLCTRYGPRLISDDHPENHRLPWSGGDTESPFPALPLFVMTGASGSGKTTLTPLLQTLLPDCLVTDTDVTSDVGAVDWDIWRNSWLKFARTMALSGRVTVLTASLTPAQLEDLPAWWLLGPIHFALLDCPEEILAERLRARPITSTPSEAAIAEDQHVAAPLRASIEWSFDTSRAGPARVAEEVARWVRARLPGRY